MNKTLIIPDARCINIVKYKTQDEKRFIHELALKNRLYVKNERALSIGLYSSYVSPVGGTSFYYVAFCKDVPVGIIRKSRESTWIFVKPKFRRQGIARQLIQRLEEDGYQFCPNWYGPKISHGFFRKMGYQKPSKAFASNLY